MERDLKAPAYKILTSVNANLNMDTETNPTLPNRGPQYSQNDTNISNEDSWAEMIFKHPKEKQSSHTPARREIN
jgi:hypothetical protein